MTERIPTPLAAKRLVYKAEELRRKCEGTWDPTTMVSVTSPEGAALLALQRASLPEKVVDTQPKNAVEQLKNETPADELATPLTTIVDNGTARVELLSPAKAATRKAEGRKTETTLLEAMGSKRSRSGGRQLKKQKLPAEISELGRKRTPERMRIFLDSLAEDAVLTHATKKAGIHRRTPENWLKGSAAGRDGYDLEWRGETMKFHEHYISALEDGVDRVRAVAYRLATGYDEILTYQGRVSYKIDRDLWSLGQRGPDAYLSGPDWKVDVTQQSGVRVIGPSKTEKREKELGGEQQTQDVEFDVNDGSEGEKGDLR